MAFLGLVSGGRSEIVTWLMGSHPVLQAHVTEDLEQIQCRISRFRGIVEAVSGVDPVVLSRFRAEERVEP